MVRMKRKPPARFAAWPDVPQERDEKAGPATAFRMTESLQAVLG
jgi:hypothetical protein